MLRPGGVLSSTLPDAGSPVARLLGARWWSVIPTHVQYFTAGASGGCWAVTATRWNDRDRPQSLHRRYYLERLEGYSAPLARAAVAVAERLRVADRLVWPDFRDRMAVLARRTA